MNLNIKGSFSYKTTSGPWLSLILPKKKPSKNAYPSFVISFIGKCMIVTSMTQSIVVARPIEANRESLIVNFITTLELEKKVQDYKRLTRRRAFPSIIL